MKVRELIHALQQHDQDMVVIVPSDPEVGIDFMMVAGFEADLFWQDPKEPLNYQLADLRGTGAFTAVRLCGKVPKAANASSFKRIMDGLADAVRHSEGDENAATIVHPRPSGGD